MKEILLSERALVIESLIAVFLGKYLFGFESTALAFLAVIAAHVFMMSWGIKSPNPSS